MSTRLVKQSSLSLITIIVSHHPSDISRTSRLAFVATMLLTACVSRAPAEEKGCDLCTTSAIVYGVAHDIDGLPVPNAVIKIDAFFIDTSRFRGSFSPESRNHPTRTNAAGEYRDRPFTLLSPFRARLKLKLIPTNAVGDTVTVDSVEVDFRSDYLGPVLDSVRVDFVVRRHMP